MANGDTVHELLAGEPVNFKAYIKNSGDADLTILGYTATVYVDQAGERGPVATDGQGNELAWSNNGVICPQGCTYTSLAAGDFLGGGETTLSDGNAFEWTPSPGYYWVEVTVETNQPGNDIGNDVYSVQVTVRNYYDIDLDVAWLDANGAPLSDSAIEGTDPVSFKVYADLLGSNSFKNIRNLSVSVSVTGDYQSNDAPANIILGELNTVDIEDDTLDTLPATTGDRLVIGFDGANTVRGESPTYTITPSADGFYSVSVEIVEYHLYEAGSCATSSTICEVRYTDADEYSGNNLDSITGSSSTIHSIALLDYRIYADGDYEDGSPYWGNYGGAITETLSPGSMLLYAEVFHDSTSQSPIYDWNVTFEITNLDTNALEHILEADSCSEFNYDHNYLGFETDRVSAEDTGIACHEFEFPEGRWYVEANLNMLGEIDSAKTDDMLPFDNTYAFTIEVENFAPQILSITENFRTIIARDTNPMTATIVVEAFDVEDSNNLQYDWSDMNNNKLTCSGTECMLEVTESMVPLYRGKVTVTDSMGATDYAVFEFQVMNQDVIVSEEGDLSAGYAAVYDITYSSTGLDVTFADGSSGESVQLDGCLGSYTVASSISFSPSTTYDASNILEHSMTVHFPNNVGIQSAWVQYGQANMLIGEGIGDEVDATTSGYTYNFGLGTDMITPGTNVIFITEECEVPAAPTGSVTGITATPGKGGSINMAWTVENLLSTEEVFLTICAEAAGCANPVAEYSYGSGVTAAKLTGQGNTVHGTTYVVEAKVCNDQGCTTPIDASAIADSEVAAVTATAVTISETDTTWVMDWDVSAVDDDIASWLVCYERGSGFDADAALLMATNGDCHPASDTSLTLDKPTIIGSYMYHFAILPVDVVGNIGGSASTDQIQYINDQDTTNPDDGTTVTDTEASSGVPTWTWGVIGAVVVVAFVVGAFILSRGEGDGDDDKEWDY
tara:strand:- start:194 stop:3064 length:2871 start_codon:yes stop_codon:yes gene_type:complete